MNHSGKRTTLLAGLIVGALSLALAGPATAKTTKLHFFQKGTSAAFAAPDGTVLQPPSATNPPVVGEKFTATDDDYVGSHKHHAKKSTASDHIVCTFTDAIGTAVCDAQIALGGSLLLAEHVTVSFGQSVVVPITGGTGAYKHARGTATSVSIGDTANSDFRVTFTT